MKEIDIKDKAIEAAKNVKKEAKTWGLNQLKKAWEQKPLHGCYIQRIINVDVDILKTNWWLKNVGLKVKIERLIIAAQDQRLSTRNYQANIIKNESNPICWLCK